MAITSLYVRLDMGLLSKQGRYSLTKHGQNKTWRARHKKTPPAKVGFVVKVYPIFMSRLDPHQTPDKGSDIPPPPAPVLVQSVGLVIYHNGALYHLVPCLTKSSIEDW